VSDEAVEAAGGDRPDGAAGADRPAEAAVAAGGDLPDGAAVAAGGDRPDEVGYDGPRLRIGIYLGIALFLMAIGALVFLAVAGLPAAGYLLIVIVVGACLVSLGSRVNHR
jgi:hypothetical protein